MMIGRQEQAWVDRTNQTPGLKVLTFGPAEMSVIHLNMTQPPLDNIKVRQAVAHALDRAGMRQFRGMNISREAVSVVPSAISARTRRRRCCRTTSPARGRCWRRPGSPTASR